MKERLESPTFYLRRNLQALMKRDGLTGAQLARKADVDAGTVNNIVGSRKPRIDVEHMPRPDLVDKIARHFGYAYWQLFLPELASDPHLGHLVRDYLASDVEGRAAIRHVAEVMASKGAPSASKTAMKKSA